jgi:hypothetical protein
MKTIALLLLMVFAGAQVAPAAMAIFTDTTSVFIVDEENCKNTEKKEKKDVEACSLLDPGFIILSNQALQLNEKIYSSAWREQLTPPPNFC